MNEDWDNRIIEVPTEKQHNQPLIQWKWWILHTTNYCNILYYELNHSNMVYNTKLDSCKSRKNMLLIIFETNISIMALIEQLFQQMRVEAMKMRNTLYS